MKVIALILGLLMAAPLLAQHADPEAVLAKRETEQRARIAQTRARYQAQFEAQERACYQRFAVNDCLGDSRRTQREVMADLRRQEILINDTQRKRRAARQMLRSDERTSDSP